MMEGKVRAALRLITDVSSSGPLNLDRLIESDTDGPESVRDILAKKHPPKQKPNLISQDMPAT